MIALSHHMKIEISMAPPIEMSTNIQGLDWYQVRELAGDGAAQLMLSKPPIELLIMV